MYFKYKKLRDNSDATTSYDLVGDFPVKFDELFNYICETENSFCIEFGSSNKKYGGWLGNRIEIRKNTETGEWCIVKQNPCDWYETIKNLPVTKCWVNGGWGQILYIVTFDEDVLSKPTLAETKEAIQSIQYRIDTASKAVGNGIHGDAFADLKLAIAALEQQIKLLKDKECI